MGVGCGGTEGQALNLFIFGCGYSASYFARTRAASFTAISGTQRDGARAAALVGAAGLQFDGAAHDARLPERLAQADALLVSIPPDGAADPALRAFRAEIAAAPRLRRIAYLSTIGVYGDHAGAWVDEASATQPGSARNKARVGVEQQWLALGAETGKAVSVLRLAGIYGPGQNVLEKLREGAAQRIVKPSQVFNRIHVEDIARAIGAALAGDHAGVCNVSDDEPAPPQDVMLFAASLLGIAPPPPLDFATAALSPMARSFYGDNKRVRNARLKRELAVALAYPTYREGLRALAGAQKAV